MRLMEGVALAFVGLSLGFYGAQFLSLWLRAGRARDLSSSPSDPFTPPVSILKPLRGLDDGLLRNLESFCHLDYPEFEIVLALADESDPAHAVAQELKRHHPGREITIVVGGCEVGLNPKVNNLIPAYQEARHDLVLISDSNVRVDKEYLRETVRSLKDPPVALVHNLIRGTGARSWGARLENLHLNSLVMGSVSLLDHLGFPLVVGKSMLLRRSALERIGGLEAVRDLLAEDYILGRSLIRAGQRVALSPHIIDNRNENWPVGRFTSRHHRWGLLRWRIVPAGYLVEPLGNPILLSALFLLAGILPAGWAALILALKTGGDFFLGRRIGADAPPWAYLAVPFKDLLAGALWLWPMVKPTVAWRGHRFRVGKDSRLYPLTDN